MPEPVTGNGAGTARCIRPGGRRDVFPDGQGSRWAKRVWEPEDKRLQPREHLPTKSCLLGTFLMSRSSSTLGEADAGREVTDARTDQSWRGKDPSAYTRIAEITSGRANSQQGHAATCKDSRRKVTS